MKHTISHKFIRPYDRQKAKEDLALIVMDYFNQLEEEHPLTFCAGLDICFYATADCLYGRKKCYYE